MSTKSTPPPLPSASRRASNAAGRLGQTDLAMELLLSDRQSPGGRAERTSLNELNNQRKGAGGQKSTRRLWQSCPVIRRFLRDRVIVLYGEGWHHGVIGIAAARIVEEYCKPCISLFD